MDGRVRFTAEKCNGITTGERELSRFEGRVVQVHTPGKRDPEGTIVVRLEKPAPVEYDLSRRGRIYFDHTMQKWYALTRNDQKVIFLPELVGVRYIAKRDMMQKFGFVIAGEDIRRILFHVLFENRKDLLRVPLTIVNTVQKKGQELDTLARDMLATYAEWFTPEETALITDYLGTR